MTSDDTDNPQPDITADEQWKSRVKAEDAALDETFQQADQPQNTTDAETGQSDEEPSAQESASTAESVSDAAAETPPLPPAGFSTLVAMFSTQAMLAMGIIPHPVSGKPESQPELARHFIDLLAVVEAKTQGNLDPSEQALLDSALHELRMAFVEMSKTSS